MSEIELKKLEILGREVQVKERELAHRIAEAEKNAWKSPIVVAVFAAAIGAIGNAVITYYSSFLDRQSAADEYERSVELADRAAEQERILEMIKIGGPDQVKNNLGFLMDAGLVIDADTVKSIRTYYDGRAPGTGPGASTGVDRLFSAPDANPAFVGCGSDLKIVPANTSISKDSADQLAEIAAATGRIEITGSPNSTWAGTGFLVHSNLFLTTRHIVETFSTDGIINPGIQIEINLDATIGCFEARRLAVEKIAFVSDTTLDFALLRVAPSPEFELGPVPIQVEVPISGAKVALASHPADDPIRRDPADLERAFGGIFEVKRIGVGQMLVSDEQRSSYGLFSSGGSAGGPVIDLETERVFAMHVGGAAGVGGYGIPLSAVLQDKTVKMLFSE